MAPQDHGRPTGAGARQQVDVVIHPEHGRCFAVWGNGPSFIQPIEGEPRSARVSAGGASVDGGSWRLVDGKRCPLLESGESHQRAWHPRMGLGWLVHLTRGDRFFVVRFEPDDGSPFEFAWTALSVGRPEYARRLERSRTRVPKHGPDEMRWMTFTTTEGEMLTFRKDGPPPERDGAPAGPTATQTELF